MQIRPIVSLISGKAVTNQGFGSRIVEQPVLDKDSLHAGDTAHIASPGWF